MSIQHFIYSMSKTERIADVSLDQCRNLDTIAKWPVVKAFNCHRTLLPKVGDHQDPQRMQTLFHL